jgi:hypothetical protein
MRQSGCKPGNGDGEIRRKESEEVSMAKVIEFYVPRNFPKRTKWIPAEQRGKLIEFGSQVRKSA